MKTNSKFNFGRSRVYSKSRQNSSVKSRSIKGKSKSSVSSKARKYAAKMKAKEVRYQAKTNMRVARLNEAAKHGGLKGSLARNLLKKVAASEADIAIQKNRPSMLKQQMKAEIESNASVKKTAARGKAGAAIASALGASYSAGKISDKESAIAKAKADIETSKALVDSLSTVPQVTTGSNGEPSVSGLVTGVR